jgi:hypothetical protein
MTIRRNAPHGFKTMTILDKTALRWRPFLRFGAFIAAGCLLTLPLPALAIEPTRLAPESTVVYAELIRPDAVMEPAFAPSTFDLLKGVDAFQKYQQSPEYGHVMMVKGIAEARLGTTWQAAVRDVLGSGICIAADPVSESVLLFVRSRKPELLTKLNDLWIELAEGDAKNKGRPSPVQSEEHQGIRGWTFGGGEAHAIIEDLLIVSNKADALKAVIDRFRDPAARGLASAGTFQQARAAMPGGAIAWSWADLAAVRKQPNVEQALANRSNNPLGELLLAGVLDTVRYAPFATASVQLEGKRLRLRAELPREASKTAATRSWFFAAPPEQGAPTSLAPKEMIATFTAFRDLAGLWLAREELFDEKTSAGFAQADSQLGLFFSGRDFGPEVLGEIQPGLRFVVARQEYAADQPVPALKLPSFALVLGLKHPGEFAKQLLLAYQNIVGFTNIIGAQQGQPQLMQSTEEYQATTITKAVYGAPPKNTPRGKAPANYNFSPSCARVGEQFIIGSTVGIVRQLVDRLKETSNTTTGDNASLSLEASPLAAILEDNRELLITQNMLTEGHSRTDAENAIGTLLQIVRLFNRAQIRLIADANVVALELSADIAGS